MMLTIRSSQMAALGESLTARFAEQIEAHLRAAMPAECAALGRAAVSAQVRSAMTQARQFAMNDQYDVMHYVSLSFLLGPDFVTELDWARDILADSRFQPSTRLAMIEEELDRQEAEELDDLAIREVA